jgi:DNA-binding response OmpR family regulator
MPLPPSLPPLEPRPSVGKDALPKIRILVAEDDPVSREVICTRLEKWGYEVIAARNGAEAMNELRKPCAPTLAILDWMMPGMDGLEICRRTREVDRTLYAIMLTACGSTENVVEGLGAGADDYLVKPVEKDELHARIRVGIRVMAERAEMAVRLSALKETSAAISERSLQFAI